MVKRLPPALLVFLITFVAYSPTLLGTFYYDDNVVFFGHQARVLAEDPFSVFSGETHYLPGAPRSIHVFFLLLIYKAFGASPLPYHMFNLLMHCATTVLVFLLLRKILAAAQGENAPAGERGLYAGGETAALLGSLLFGLHPVHVENITFVTLGGTDVFYTFWAMLSLVSYVWFRDGKLAGRRNYVLLACSALFYYFALLSKESAIAFVLVYPLTEFVLRGRGFLWALPHVAVLAFAKRGLVLGTAPSVMRQVAGAEPGGVGPAEIIKSLGFFLKSAVVPYPHMPFVKEFPVPSLLYAFAALAVLWLLAGVISRRRIIVYSALWFIGVSVPYMFVPAATKNVAITAERYVYAPSVALAVLGAWALAAGGGRVRSAARYFAAVVLIIYAVLGSVYFYEAWRTEEAFWSYAVKSNPGYVSGYTNLASIELERGNASKAKALLREGLGKRKGMKAEFAQTAYTLADIYRREGDLSRAESYYMLSLNYTPYEFSFIDLGFLYLETGRPGQAKEAFENALRFRRNNARVLAGLALAHLKLGEKQKAAHYARQAHQFAREERLRAAAADILKEASK